MILQSWYKKQAMDIIPLGLSSFRLRGKSVTLVTDPYDSALVGLKFPKHIEAAVVTVSHDHKDHNAIFNIEGTPYIVKGPGEYDIQGVSIVGFSSFHDEKAGSLRGKNTIFRIEIDGIVIVHMGDLGHNLSSAQIESLDGVDVLMIPVGGTVTIDAKNAVSVVKEIDPSIVIPMHYHKPELNQKTFGELEPVSAFVKELGKEAVTMPKLSLTREKITEEMQLIILE